MKYHFRNLVFEGGGVKGIAYVGALGVLKERDILKNIKRIGGTSAGAINALLLSLGYTLAEKENILSKLDFNNFLDDSWGIIRDLNRLKDDFGWYKGDFFRKWIGSVIKDKTGNEHSTFNDIKNLKFKELYLIGTNLSTGFSEVFSFEHTPRMRLVDAVRISMSIPLFFAAVRNIRKDVYVDGGVLDNYPVKLFDREKYVARSNRKKYCRHTEYYKKDNISKPKTSSNYIYNKETLGFRLDSEREIAMFRDGAEPIHEEINDFFDYAWSLIKTVMNAQNNQHLHTDDWHRTVYIDTIGVGTTDFNLSEEKKKNLIEQGVKGTLKYFEWYDKSDPDDMPINHPNCDI